jgi:hypothetical protein
MVVQATEMKSVIVPCRWETAGSVIASVGADLRAVRIPRPGRVPESKVKNFVLSFGNRLWLALIPCVESKKGIRP